MTDLAKIRKALAEFRAANSFNSKGQLAIALQVTRLAKTQGIRDRIDIISSS